MKKLTFAAFAAALMLSASPAAVAQGAGAPDLMSADDLACRTMGVGPDCVAVIVGGEPTAAQAAQECEPEDRKEDGTCTPVIDMSDKMRGPARFRAMPGVSTVPNLGVVVSSNTQALPSNVQRVNMPKKSIPAFVARVEPERARNNAEVARALRDPTAICQSAAQASNSANGFANLCIQFDNASTNFTNPAWADRQLINVVQMLNRDDVRSASRVEVEIMGHANRTGSEGINTSLSMARAEKVRQWLQARVPANVVVKSDGRGYWQPVSFATPVDAVNRRVEMKVTRMPASSLDD